MMAHAETCPVCMGDGVMGYADEDGQDLDDRDVMICHGCNGAGWITVQDRTTSSPLSYMVPGSDTARGAEHLGGNQG